MQAKITELGKELFSAIPDMLVLYDRDATILDVVNPKQELVDSFNGSLIGLSLTEEPLKSAIGDEIRHFLSVRDTKEPQQFVFSHRGYDGETHFYEVFLSCLKEDRIIANIRTVTKQAVAQIESEHLHYFFSEVLDNIAIPVSVRNLDTGRYIFWSKMSEVFGSNADQMVGAVEDPFMSPEQSCSVHETDRLLAEGKEKRYQGIEVYTLADGQEHTFMVTKTRFAFGTENLLLCTAVDISDLTKIRTSLMRTKEELAVKNMELSSVLSIAQVISWECDLVARIFSCDYATYHYDGSTDADAEGRYSISIDGFFSRIHPDYRESIVRRFEELAAGNIGEFHETYPIHWYNEEEYEWVEAHSIVSEVKRGAGPVRLLGSIRVITGQKRLEDTLREAKEQAEQSNMLKSAFLANMSHEIRTPLNAIVGFSELLAEAEQPEEKREYLSIINNSNALLLQLISDILDLSKIEAGTLEFSMGRYDLNILMEELEQTARMKVGNADVEVAWTSRLPYCTVYTDRNRLLQVLHNFVNNAAKFTRKGHIHFGYLRRPDGKWYFYVEDTGCGIPADRMNDVFGRFVKLNSQVQGTGLGLAISKSIIERLGGRIGVDSAEGRGSTFWFVLPSESVTTKASSTEEHTDREGAYCTVCRSLTLLVVEDDAANYRLFDSILRKDYTLLHAWNGREAVEMYSEHRPDMVLMDIRMPEMDGYEATAAIRNLSADVPILAVTAFAYPEDERRILSMGFSGVYYEAGTKRHFEGQNSRAVPEYRERRTVSVFDIAGCFPVRLGIVLIRRP